MTGRRARAERGRDETAPGRATRITGLVLLAGSLVGVAVVGALLVPLLAPLPSPAAAISAPPEPPPGGEVLAPDARGPDTASAPRVSVPRPDPLPTQPLSLSIPRLGLTANVGSMSVPADGRVNPPTPGSAYWIRGYGTAGPASDNTFYLAGHTFRKGTAVFNTLLDVPNSDVTVVAGDDIEVTTPSATFRYTVTGTAIYDKATTDSESELWKRMPGRLAIVTCFQYNGGTSSTQNVVVYAQLTG